MNWLRRLARAVSGRLGRDSAVINALRPAYEHLLEAASGGRGIEQLLNGHERFFISPRCRSMFPEVYDPVAMAWLRSRVRPGSTCLNVGAHVGIYALCLAEWSKPDGRVVAFEPNPATRSVLERHVRLNHLAGRVRVERAAVGDRVGEATFVAEGAEGTSRLGSPGPATSRPTTALTVPLVTIDHYVAAHGLAPDWITLDIEGYELSALSGAQRTIAARGAALALVVEMHPNAWGDTGWTRMRAQALLADLGLVVTPLTGQRDPLGEYGLVALERPDPGKAA